jgi:hypothetical protein
MKTIGIYLSIFYTSICLFTCCDKINNCEDDKLSLSKQSFSGNQLKINGYYIEDKLLSNEFTTLKFYFNNGIILGFTGYNNETNRSGNINVNRINSSLKSKAAWGTFKIIGNIIEAEQWEPSASGCFKIIYEKGEIKSDTTFVITHREYRDNNKVVKVENPNSTFYFRPLLQKPDSVNNFIK